MILVDKEGANKDYIKINDEPKKEYASKALAGTALGFGIGGTALWLFDKLCNGVGHGHGQCPTGMNIVTPNEQYLERKECSDALELTNAIWRQSMNNQTQRFADRQTINTEMFGIYQSMRNGFDGIVAKHNKDSFDLYKYSRDGKDELSKELGDLKCEVAVLKATRPYQDALIQCDIRRVAEHADFNLYRRTCRMISGQVVLPSTPEVTGYGSYNNCYCNQPAAPAQTV